MRKPFPFLDGKGTCDVLDYLADVRASWSALASASRLAARTQLAQLVQVVEVARAAPVVRASGSVSASQLAGTALLV